jgi:ribosomal protein L37E
MSDSNEYTCKKCGASFRVLKWPQCSNCGEPLPDEIRAKYSEADDEKVAKWQSLLSISSPPERAASRKQRRSLASEQSIDSWDPASQISADAKAIVASQNKTTQAFRSLALFFFISLQSGLGGSGLVSLAIYFSNGQINSGTMFFIVVGVLISVVGFIVAVWVGRAELDKSRN